MVLMGHTEFMKLLKDDIPKEELCSIKGGPFLITNYGIQIWLFLRPYVDSSSVFKARLPCSLDPAILVNLWTFGILRRL